MRPSLPVLAVILALAAAALGGCGQKGALYLPEAETQASPATAEVATDQAVPEEKAEAGSENDPEDAAEGNTGK